MPPPNQQYSNIVLWYNIKLQIEQGISINDDNPILYDLSEHGRNGTITNNVGSEWYIDNNEVLIAGEDGTRVMSTKFTRIVQTILIKWKEVRVPDTPRAWGYLFDFTSASNSADRWYKAYRNDETVGYVSDPTFTQISQDGDAIIEFADTYEDDYHIDNRYLSLFARYNDIDYGNFGIYSIVLFRNRISDKEEIQDYLWML